MNHLSNINQIGQYGEIKADLDLVLSKFYEYKWYQKFSSMIGDNGTGRNKLRTLKGSSLWSIMLKHLCQGRKDQPWPSFVWV